jgi:predicted GH43/DUF377 family glycosyl hydrolase
MDEKWPNSNYGPDIDLAAPADSIYCMLADSEYIYASGTSLAAPIVAGVAGLVIANNPDWNGIQAAEQIRVTTDLLSGTGADLGRGRINAYRALTESPISIKYVEFDYVDDNHNGFVEAGERVNMYLTMINYLTPAPNVSLKISSSSEEITFINEEITTSSIDSYQQIRFPDPIVFDILDNTKGVPFIEFDLQIKSEGYHEMDQFTFTQTFMDIPWKKYNDPETKDNLYSNSDPVLKSGPSGDWDSNFASVLTVMYDSISSIFKMWYQGGTGPFTGSIGYATSPDGINWMKYDDPATTDPPYLASDPVLNPGSQGTWDSKVTGMASIVIQDDFYHMWYTGISDSAYFNIGYAISSDGIFWEKYDDNPVLKIGLKGSWDETRVYLPCVIHEDSLFKMWYSGSQGNPFTGENFKGQIGYAISSDGIVWTKGINPVLEPQRTQGGEFDFWNVLSPDVLYDGSNYQMWYAGYNNPKYSVGMAKSLNGVDWYRGNNNPVLEVGSEDEWDYPIVQNPKVILIDTTYHMWYSGGQLFGWQIGYARSSWDGLSGDLDDGITENIPQNYSLSRNYPNPFNPRTIINYELPITNEVNLIIYNILGKKVVTLVSEKQNAGYHQVEWDASDFASGVYFYRLKAGDYQAVKKMVLLR